MASIIETDFPSIFMSDCPVDYVQRLSDVNTRLIEDLKWDTLSQEARARILNFQTYIYFQLWRKNCCEEKCAAENLNKPACVDNISLKEVCRAETLDYTLEVDNSSGALNCKDLTNTPDNVMVYNGTDMIRGNSSNDIYSYTNTEGSKEISALNSKNFKNALTCNEEVIQMTDWQNGVSIVYRYHLMNQNCNMAEVDLCRKKLYQVKSTENYDVMFAELKAQTGYIYSSLGGFYNIQCAIDCYKEALQTCKKCLDVTIVWKLGLGIAHSRMVCWYTSSTLLSIPHRNIHMMSAVRCLLEIAESTYDKEIRSQAFSHLAVFKRFLCNTDIDTDDCRKAMGDRDVHSLVEEALSLNPENPKTLRDCGRLLKKINLDQAIEILEKSASKVENSVTYHNLGICYEQKARKEGFSMAKMCANNERLHSISSLCHNVTTVPDKTDAHNSDTSQPCVNTPVSCKSCNVHLVDEIQHDVPKTDQGRKKKKKRKKMTAPHISCPVKVDQLDINSHLVKKAIACHEKSLQVSSNQNVAAMYTLGLIFRSCGCTEDAKVQFTNITLKNNHSVFLTNHLALICAHLQLGFCALEDKPEPLETDYHQCTSSLKKTIEILTSLGCNASQLDKVEHRFDLVIKNLQPENNVSNEKSYSRLNCLKKFTNVVLKTLHNFELSANK